MARRGRRSVLERNQRIIGTVGLIVIATLTVLALMLQGGLLTPRYSVTASFTDAAGIVPGDRVTVAGLPAGEVRGVQVEEGAAVLQLGVDDDVELSHDSRAEIVIETLLGRRSVALIDGRSEEALADGSTIPLERTTTPVSIIELNDVSVRLLEASDADAFEQMMEQLSAVTEGKAEELRAIIAGLTDVARAVNSRSDELEGLIDSLRTLSAMLAGRDDRIVSLIDNMNVVLGNLADRQQQLTELLEHTDVGSHETANLIRRNRAALDGTLRSLHTDLHVLNRHQIDLAATIAYLNQAVQGYSSVGYSFDQPNEWANIFVQSLGPLGVDNLIGECGAVDQLFDEIMGADCETSAPPDSDDRDTPAERSEDPAEPPPAPDPEEAVAEIPEALPCGVSDLITSVVGPAPEGRCAA